MVAGSRWPLTQMAGEISPKLGVSLATDQENSRQKMASSLRVHLFAPVNLQGVCRAGCRRKKLWATLCPSASVQKGDEWKSPSCCMCEWVRLWVKVPSGCSSCLRRRIVSWYKMHDFRQKQYLKMKNESAVYLLQQCGGMWVVFSLQPSGAECARAAFQCVYT